MVAIQARRVSELQEPYGGKHVPVVAEDRTALAFAPKFNGNAGLDAAGHVVHVLFRHAGLVATQHALRDQESIIVGTHQVERCRRPAGSDQDLGEVRKLCGASWTRSGIKDSSCAARKGPWPRCINL